MKTTFQNILHKIEEYSTIIIHRHQKPDPDALGSQNGLKEILKTNFPEKQIFAVGYDEPTLSYLAKMDAIEDKTYDNALVIVTDTSNIARIDDNRYTSGKYLIKIDHHPNDTPYGDLLYVDTNASSASEIITEFALEMGLAITDKAAHLLYAGIAGDTGRFLYPSTTSKTLQFAAHLRTYNFDFGSLMRQMDSFSLKTAKLQAYILENMEIHETGAARIFLTQDILKKFDITEAETSSITGIPGQIDITQSWAIFIEQNDGSYRVRLRSKYKPINYIAKRHNGGGHPLASGAISKSEKEHDQIFQELINNLV